MLLWRFGHAAYRSRSKTAEALAAIAMRSVRLRISIHGARGAGAVIDGALAASASAGACERYRGGARSGCWRSGDHRSSAEGLRGRSLFLLKSPTETGCGMM